MILPDRFLRNAIAVLFLAVPFSLLGEDVPVPNGDFEAGPTGWDFSSSKDTASITSGSGVVGTQGLRIESSGDDTGAFVASERLAVEPGVAYTLAWQGRVVSGTGTNVYLRFFDSSGAEILREEGRITTDRGFQWEIGTLRAVPPAGATQMDVIVQRPPWRPSKYCVEIDNFTLTKEPVPVTAPWEGTYKLRPDETSRLTAADVVGPDGRVYPDWTWAGVPGGIPDLPVVVRLADLGAADGTNISPLLEQAVAKAAAAGGGAIEIGEGTFFLDEPVMIFADNIVLRGAGREKTKLVFRYAIPAGEIRFFRLEPEQVVGQAGVIEFHAKPKNLEALELKSGDVSLQRRVRKDHWGNTFSLRHGVRQAIDQLGEGRHVFTAIAEYSDGRRVESTIPLQLSRTWTGETAPAQLGAINFVGRGAVSDRIPLAADAARGTRVIELPAGHGFVPGDRLNIVAPASPRWRELVGHSSHWDIQAQDLAEVAAVDGGRVTLAQPLRIRFPKEDGSFVQKFEPVKGGGVEGVFLEQEIVADADGQRRRPSPDGKTPTEDLWINGVMFSNAWGSWLRDSTIKNAGRNPTYFLTCKHIEARDCVFDDSLFKADGGTGYVGFDRTFDSVLENIEARRLRHGPNAQWNASGNVVRNSRFLGSDAQWHAGFSHENLYENNFVDARGRFGSYGHGLYASGPSSGIHGPQGPRNVVYNNDIVCRRDGLHMLGGNEGWLILFNRFTLEGPGRAVFAKEKSFDHIIEGNVFILRSPVNPAVFLGSDSVGVELVGNQFYGATEPLVGFAGGITQLARNEGNVVHPEVPIPVPERPVPAVASIFQWQRENSEKIRARALADSVPPAATPLPAEPVPAAAEPSPSPQN